MAKRWRITLLRSIPWNLNVTQPGTRALKPAGIGLTSPCDPMDVVVLPSVGKDKFLTEKNDNRE